MKKFCSLILLTCLFLLSSCGMARVNVNANLDTMVVRDKIGGNEVKLDSASPEFLKIQEMMTEDPWHLKENKAEGLEYYFMKYPEDISLELTYLYSSDIKLPIMGGGSENDHITGIVFGLNGTDKSCAFISTENSEYEDKTAYAFTPSKDLTDYCKELLK